MIGIAEKNPDDLNFLVDLVAAGELRVVVDRTYPLEAAAEAHRYVDGGHKVGNVVLIVGRGDD